MGIVRGGDQAEQAGAAGQKRGHAVGDGLERVKMQQPRVDVAAADGMILAIDALQRAVGEENVHYAVAAADGRLLTPVQAHGGGQRTGRCAAVAVAA